jgi:hypothetical protein
MILSKIFTGNFACPHKTKKFLTKSDFNLPPVHSTNLSHTETAQGYEGAADMSGIHRGVQARIRERIPTALYVHCNAHVLNLAIVHSSSDVSVKTVMAFAFQYSSKNG